MSKKDKQIGIRVPEELLKKYTEMCNEANSIMSLRLRKFIELELVYKDKNKDALNILNNGK